MKALTLTTQILASLMIFSTGSLAFGEGCFLKDHPEQVVSDKSIPNQKKLWNACIDKKLAALEAINPNFTMDEGQAIGDDCTTSPIVCENI